MNRKLIKFACNLAVLNQHVRKKIKLKLISGVTTAFEANQFASILFATIELYHAFH